MVFYNINNRNYNLKYKMFIILFQVRWADMEERREQEKMRAIGFVVGQTDWDRMLGRDQGESKLTQTKYI